MAGRCGLVEPSRILISGWYGNGNLGDEAVLAGMLEAISRALPGARVTALSDDAALTRREHGLAAAQRDARGHRRRLWSETRAIARNDVLAIGGGGLVKDFGRYRGNVHAWVRPGMVAAAMRRRTMWYAVGVDDVHFPDSVDVVRRASRRLDLLTVRDDGSARRLREMGVTREVLVTADPALLLGRALARPGGTAPLVAVCPRLWKAGGPDVDDPELQGRLFDELAAALDRLVREAGAEVVLIPFQARAGDDDRVVCRAVRDRMSEGGAALVTGVPDSPAAAAELL